MKLNELLNKCGLRTINEDVNEKISSGDEELTSGEVLLKAEGEARLDIIKSNFKLNYTKTYRNLETAYERCVGNETDTADQDSELIMNLYDAIDEYSRVRGKLEVLSDLTND